MLRWNPLASLIIWLWYTLTGRLCFHGESVGRTVAMPDGKRFVVFRHAWVAPASPERNTVIFSVRFRLARMSVEQNIRFSLLPIPFFTGLPGFRSKHWLVCRATEEFHGVYEWDRPEFAERYAHSFAMRFMMRRAVPNSVSWQIEPTFASPLFQALRHPDHPAQIP